MKNKKLTKIPPLAYNRDRDQRESELNERNEREKLESARMQQNGHRSGAPVVDADLLERVKQRKEEEEKRVNERRMAAAKKLQELEQRLNKKKELHSENENETSSVSSGQNYGKTESIDSRTNERYGRDEHKTIRDKDSREYGNRYESRYERDMGSRERGGGGVGGGAPNAADSGAFFNKPFQSNLPPRFQKQQQERHYKVDAPPSHRPSPREHIRRPDQQQPQRHPIKRNDDHPKGNSYYSHSKSNEYSSHGKSVESEDDDRVSSGRESISRNSAGERPLNRSTSDSSQPDLKDRIGSWADEMDIDMKQTQRQISSTSSASANDDIQPKQILQRVRKVSIESRSDKEKSEERELLSTSNASVKSHNSQEDVSKHFGTSPIEAPKSWADSSPTTPEIARKSTEILSDSSTTKTIDGEKKPLESVLENEPIDVNADKKLDDKSGLIPGKPSGRGYSKDTYSSDDGKSIVCSILI